MRKSKEVVEILRGIDRASVEKPAKPPEKKQSEKTNLAGTVNAALERNTRLLMGLADDAADLAASVTDLAAALGVDLPGEGLSEKQVGEDELAASSGLIGDVLIHAGQQLERIGGIRTQIGIAGRAVRAVLAEIA